MVLHVTLAEKEVKILLMTVADNSMLYTYFTDHWWAATHISQSLIIILAFYIFLITWVISGARPYSKPISSHTFQN